jgi:polyisoprenoid-binding protein YceI
MVHTTTPPTTSSPQRKRWVIPVSHSAWSCFSGEAPAEVDLAATASSVADDIDLAPATTASDDEPTEASATGIEGTWTIDTSVGEFTVADATTATFVGFRVEAVLNSIGSTTAVGRTPDVRGSTTIEGTTLMSAEIKAELTSIVSDEPRREDSIQDALNTASNPTATFVLTEPIDLGTGAAEGEAIAVTATGELTINGVTSEVEIELDARLIDGTILVTGATDIAFADYDITTPTALMVSPSKTTAPSKSNSGCRDEPPSRTNSTNERKEIT